MSETLTYREFLERKQAPVMLRGIDRVPVLPPRLFDFQRAIVERHLRLGRGAIFAGTGLGKTGMQLAWADVVEQDQQGPVLVLAPLAVADQTIAEALKFGIPGVAYAASQRAICSRIVITNYDRLDQFDPTKFCAVVLDESSIIKSHDSATRIALTDAFRSHSFKLACSATPAPNDWTELGNHAEFLGVMTAKEMLATYFVHDGAIRAIDGDADADGWRLKRHATRDFWAWVASWSTLVRHPREIGFDHAGYDLPPLHKHQITVSVAYAPSLETGALFPVEAHTMGERLAARRDSVGARVGAAADLINASPDRPWLVWCHLNSEADALERKIPGSLQVKGSHERDTKSERLLGFCEGQPRVLISKPSIAGMGLNYQHCRDMVFCGLNDSFEQLFQAIRRCWRFGQTKPVNVYMVASELEGAVVANLERKELAHEAMADAMAEHMKDFTAEAFGRQTVRCQLSHEQKMELPQWLLQA